MPRIISTKKYELRLKKFKLKHPELRDRYVNTILLLGVNPSHPSLRLHRLKGKLSEIHSVSINKKYRILIDFIIKKDKIILLNIGTHDELYR